MLIKELKLLAKQHANVQLYLNQSEAALYLHLMCWAYI